MARQILSEFQAKTMLATRLKASYHGLALDAQADWRQHLSRLSTDERYVVKVDEGIKGRFKKGLVRLNLPAAEVAPAAESLFDQDYRYVLVEPYRTHAPEAERYLAIERTRAGNVVTTSVQGGINVEDSAQLMTSHFAATPADIATAASEINLPAASLTSILELFDAAYMGFLEINPLIIENNEVTILDAAIEVDGEATQLTGGLWSIADIRTHHKFTPEEAAIAELASRSQSSFRLEVLNPQGQIFLLLSGGGASVTLADEVHNQGYGAVLGNYGEYSGNPTADETYVYTAQILKLLLGSPARPKVLVVAGGVANFTDIRVTFSGVIRAITEVKDQLLEQGVKVYVRRGGPHEAEGLSHMEAALRTTGLFGAVAGPEMILADIIPAALEYVGQVQT